jgi:TonB-dependent receptor
MKHWIAATLAKAGVAGICIGSAVAYAQQSAAPAAGEAPLQEVVVSGYRGSLETALATKRAAVNLTDSISAEDVGKLPDNNLAEALQRVPGVQITRTNGEGQQISVRGLGPSFARVLLDGMPISVASEGSVDQAASSREFDFDLLPSEIFSQLEISKTPHAGLVEGGLSGTINLRTPRPFDFKGFTATYQLEGTYQSNSEKVDPRGSILVSQTWGDQFGALLSLSGSQRQYRTDGWTSQGWTSGNVGPRLLDAQGRPLTVTANPPDVGYAAGFDWNLPSVTNANPASTAPTFVNESGLTNAELANAQVPRLGRPETQVGDRDRVGGTIALQWRPTDRLRFDLDGLYSKLEADFDRYVNNLLVRATSASTNNATGFGFITPRNFVLDSNRNVASGTLEGAKFWSENRVFQQSSDFKHLGLNANWDVNDKVSVEMKASDAKSDFRWRMTTYLLLSQPGNVDLAVRNGIPEITPSLDLANSANWRLNAVRVQPRTRNEENKNLALNVRLGEEEKNLRVGALYNSFYRERLTFSSAVGTTQGAALAPYGYTGPNNLSQFDLTNYSRPVPVDFGKGFDDPSGYSSWTVADMGAFGELMDYGVLDAAANLDYQNSGSFEENSKAAYIEANARRDLFGRELRANLGVRYVKTDVDLLGFVRTTSTPTGPLFGLGPEDYARRPLSSDYAKTLPSLNLAYDLSDQLIARFAASRAMTRPNPNDIQPFTSFSTSAVVSQGNPNLNPYLSDQLDGGLEWYFSKGSVLGVNTFYKEITGFVERRRLPGPFRNAGIPLETITDPTLLALLPQGLDTVVLFNTPVNLESVVYLKGAEVLYQQRLDRLLRGMGASINYTYLDPGKALITGLAKKNYNAVVYYEPGTFAVRLSYNYRDDYIECTINCGSTSPLVGYRKAAGYLDLSSSYDFSAFGQELSVSLQALNLTEEHEYSFYGFENRTNTLNEPGRQYILGIRGKF